MDRDGLLADYSNDSSAALPQPNGPTAAAHLHVQGVGSGWNPLPTGRHPPSCPSGVATFRERERGARNPVLYELAAEGQRLNLGYCRMEPLIVVLDTFDLYSS